MLHLCKCNEWYITHGVIITGGLLRHQHQVWSQHTCTSLEQITWHWLLKTRKSDLGSETLWTPLKHKRADQIHVGRRARFDNNENRQVSRSQRSLLTRIKKVSAWSQRANITTSVRLHHWNTSAHQRSCRPPASTSGLNSQLYPLWQFRSHSSDKPDERRRSQRRAKQRKGQDEWIGEGYFCPQATIYADILSCKHLEKDMFTLTKSVDFTLQLCETI